MLTATDGDYNLSSIQLSSSSESRAASHATGRAATTEADKLKEELEALKTKYNDLWVKNQRHSSFYLSRNFSAWLILR